MTGFLGKASPFPGQLSKGKEQRTENWTLGHHRSPVILVMGKKHKCTAHEGQIAQKYHWKGPSKNTGDECRRGSKSYAHKKNKSDKISTQIYLQTAEANGTEARESAHEFGHPSCSAKLS